MSTSTINDWTIVSLGEVGDIKTGRLDSNRAEERGKYPFFTCAPNPLKINDFAFDVEAILLAGNNADGIFHLNYYKGKFNAYQRTYVITVKNRSELDLRYLFYYLQLSLNLMRNFSQGTSTKFLTMRILNDLEITLPSIETQQDISKTLSDLDDKIKTNQQMSKTLESIGQAVFKRWFVDFEFPNQEGKPYKSSGGQMVETELGKIPKGWEIDRLGNRATVKGRIGWKGLQVAEYVNEGPCIVGGTQLMDCHVNWAECPHITKERYDESPEIMLKPTDILMTKDGTIGKLAYVDELEDPATVASGIFVIRSNSSKINQMYLLSYFKSEIFGNLVESRIEGSVVPHLYQRDIENMLMVVPSDQMSKKFENTLSAFQRRIDLNAKSSIALRKIRDSLLPRLMSGKIRVPLEKQEAK